MVEFNVFSNNWSYLLKMFILKKTFEVQHEQGVGHEGGVQHLPLSTLRAPLLAPLNEGLPEAMPKICLEFISSLSFFYDAEAGDKKINDCIAWHVNASPLRAAFVGRK